MSLENGLPRLKSVEVGDQPNIAVRICLGANNVFAHEHHPFVVIESGRIIGEYDNLEDALANKGAKLYGSIQLCSACSQLTFEQIILPALFF